MGDLVPLHPYRRAFSRPPFQPSAPQKTRIAWGSIFVWSALFLGGIAFWVGLIWYFSVISLMSSALTYHITFRITVWQILIAGLFAAYAIVVLNRRERFKRRHMQFDTDEPRKPPDNRPAA